MATPKMTPKDATDFEREQLRFLLTGDDIAATLAELNPSLAWLPILAEMKLIDAETQLAPWIEKNFLGADAVHEVAANIWFFGRDTADMLEFRLNRMAGLSSPLLKSWRLIIRHMREDKRGALRDVWFDIQPRIKLGEKSPELLEQIAGVLRPKLKVGRRLSWYDDERGGEPERPSDLMSIDYEVEDGITDEEVLSAWPEDTAAEVDDKLLKLLTNTLSVAVEDAIEVGVESNTGYGTSDIDVPSVSRHSQNAYRTGFLPIVRVIADLWTRLIRKNEQLALPFLELWRASPLRLIRRLALFAAADASVPADTAADVLVSVPQGELFLTGSSVEVYRLVVTRWHNFLPEKQQVIESRIIEGPPADWFRDDSEKERLIDRSRFDFLGHLDRCNIQLSTNAEAVLDEIHQRWPQWKLRPQEQAGFHIWSVGSSGVVGDPEKLRDVGDDQLVSEAKKVADKADFIEGDAWRALCQSDPPRALRGLQARAEAGQWEAWAWRPFLWSGQNLDEFQSVTLTVKLLLSWPREKFFEVSDAASWWLNEKAKTLEEETLWPLWDRIEESSPREVEEMQDE